MPKFLDRPQWFDDWGQENFSSGVQYIEVDNGDTITILTTSSINYPPGRYRLKWVGNRGSAVSFNINLNGGTIAVDYTFSSQEVADRSLYGIEAVYFDLYEMAHKNSIYNYCYIVFHNLRLENTQSESLAGGVIGVVSYGSSFAVTCMGSSSPMLSNNLSSYTINGLSSFIGEGIYAPITNPSGGKILQSNGDAAPQWTDFKINNAALGTSTSSIYAPTSGGTSGYLLASGGLTSTPVWRSIQLNGSQLGGGTKTFYAPTTQGTAGQILTSSGVSSGPPTWKSFTKQYQHNLHLTFALDNNAGNVVYFSIITSNPDGYTTVVDAFHDAYEFYNNATIVATGTVYFPGLIYSMWMKDGATLGVNYMNLSSNSISSTTEMYTRFVLQRDLVVPVFN